MAFGAHQVGQGLGATRKRRSSSSLIDRTGPRTWKCSLVEGLSGGFARSSQQIDEGLAMTRARLDPGDRCCVGRARTSAAEPVSFATRCSGAVPSRLCSANAISDTHRHARYEHSAASSAAGSTAIAGRSAQDASAAGSSKLDEGSEGGSRGRIVPVEVAQALGCTDGRADDCTACSRSYAPQPRRRRDGASDGAAIIGLRNAAPCRPFLGPFSRADWRRVREPSCATPRSRPSSLS